MHLPGLDVGFRLRAKIPLRLMGHSAGSEKMVLQSQVEGVDFETANQLGGKVLVLHVKLCE